VQREVRVAARAFASVADAAHRTLRVYRRGSDGTRESRRYRERGLVPGIMYGVNEDCTEERYLVALPRSTLEREAANCNSFECRVFDMELVTIDPAAMGLDTSGRDGGLVAAIEECSLRDREALRDNAECGGAPLTEGMEVTDRCAVVPRDMQLHPVTDDANSVNFIRYLNRAQRERAFKARNKSTKSRSKLARGLKVRGVAERGEAGLADRHM
jgi:ribosomal protein L25 (general stress protein Ctc)